MKELEKNYNPSEIEDKFYHRDAAAKHHRTASYGPCAG